MSFGPNESTDYIGGVDYSEFTQIGRFNTATVVTGQINANGTEQFKASEDEDFVESVTKIPEKAELPERARLIAIKLNAKGSTTDTTLTVSQSSGFDEIDQVAQIENISSADPTETFNLSGALGVPFTNKEQENQIYFEVDELSGNTAEYDIEFNWLNILR